MLFYLVSSLTYPRPLLEEMNLSVSELAMIAIDDNNTKKKQQKQ